jgi:hypothetical protein
LRIEHGANNSSPKKINVLRKFSRSRRPGQIPWINDQAKEKIDMRFGTWNVRNVFRPVLLRAVMEEILKYKLDLRSDGMEVAPNQQVNIHFSMERGMKIMNKVQVFCT